MRISTPTGTIRRRTTGRILPIGTLDGRQSIGVMDWTCTNCGRKSGPHAGSEGVPLHAHHEHPLSEGGSNQLSNLTTLCESCHNQAHEHDITADLDRSLAETVRAWLERLKAVLTMVLVCTIVHLGIAVVLGGPLLGLDAGIGTERGKIQWFVAGGYGVLLLAYMYRRPRAFATVFGLSGGVAVGLLAVVSGAQQPMLLPAVAGLFWLPAALAAGWIAVTS